MPFNKLIHSQTQIQYVVLHIIMSIIHTAENMQASNKDKIQYLESEMVKIMDTIFYGNLLKIPLSVTIEVITAKKQPEIVLKPEIFTQQSTTILDNETKSYNNAKLFEKLFRAYKTNNFMQIKKEQVQVTKFALFLISLIFDDFEIFDMSHELVTSKWKRDRKFIQFVNYSQENDIFRIDIEQDSVTICHEISKSNINYEFEVLLSSNHTKYSPKSNENVDGYGMILKYVGLFSEGHFTRYWRWKGTKKYPNGMVQQGGFRDNYLEFVNRKQNETEIIQIDENQTKFEGVQFFNRGKDYDERIIYGKRTFSNAEIQEGAFYNRELVEGEFVRNNWKGNGRKTSERSVVCEGEFDGDNYIWNWVGTRTFPNGIVERGRFYHDELMEGEFDTGKYKGKGRITNLEGVVFEGEFDGSKDQMDWVGAKIYPNGHKETGKFVDSNLVYE